MWQRGNFGDAQEKDQWQVHTINDTESEAQVGGESRSRIEHGGGEGGSEGSGQCEELQLKLGFGVGNTVVKLSDVVNKSSEMEQAVYAVVAAVSTGGGGDEKVEGEDGMELEGEVHSRTLPESAEDHDTQKVDEVVAPVLSEGEGMEMEVQESAEEHAEQEADVVASDGEEEEEGHSRMKTESAEEHDAQKDDTVLAVVSEEDGGRVNDEKGIRGHSRMETESAGVHAQNEENGHLQTLPTVTCSKCHTEKASTSATCMRYGTLKFVYNVCHF